MVIAGPHQRSCHVSKRCSDLAVLEVGMGEALKEPNATSFCCFSLRVILLLLLFLLLLLLLLLRLLLRLLFFLLLLLQQAASFKQRNARSNRSKKSTKQEKHYSYSRILEATETEKPQSKREEHGSSQA